MVAVRLDYQTYLQIRALARRDRTSFAEALRELVDLGLEVDALARAKTAPYVDLVDQDPIEHREAAA